MTERKESEHTCRGTFGSYKLPFSCLPRFLIKTITQHFFQALNLGIRNSVKKFPLKQNTKALRKALGRQSNLLDTLGCLNSLTRRPSRLSSCLEFWKIILQIVHACYTFRWKVSLRAFLGGPNQKATCLYEVK